MCIIDLSLINAEANIHAKKDELGLTPCDWLDANDKLKDNSEAQQFLCR